MPHLAPLVARLLGIGVGLSASAVFAAAPVVDGFSAAPATVPPGGTATLTVTAHDPDCPDTCASGCGQYIRADLTAWTATGGSFVVENDGTSSSPYTASAEWVAPESEGTYTISVYLADSGTFLCGGRNSITTSLDLVVTTSTNRPPVVESLTAVPAQLYPEQGSNLACVASDPDDDPLAYEWSADTGTVTPGAAGSAVFASSVPGIANVTCTVTDAGGLFAADTAAVSIVGAVADKVIDANLFAPQRLSVDSTGNVYVVDRSGGGISVVNLFSGELVYRLFLPRARAVAVDWSDNLLIGDSERAWLVTRRGDPLLALIGDGDLGDISDVAVDRTHRRYAVLHRSAGRVIVYDEDGVQIAAFGATGDAADQLMSPHGLAATADGKWVVADSGHGQIKVFSIDPVAGTGALALSFGTRGGGVGEFVQLDDVEVDSAGRIYATDAFQDWLQVFEPDGSVREVLGTYGSGPGEFKTPTGVALAEGYDRLLVASANTSNLHVFRASDDPITVIPEPEVQLSPLSLVFPPQPVGSDSTAATVLLTNSGDAPLGLLDVTVDHDFGQSNDCGAFVDPGETCAVQVISRPRGVGPTTGTLELDARAAGGPYGVSLSGEGFVPAGVRLEPTRLDYSDQPITTLSDPETVTLTNTGTVPLEIAFIVASAEYVQANDCPSSLPAGAGCTLTVTFAPVTVADEIPGTLSVVSNALGSPHSIALDGRGIPGPLYMSIDDRSLAEGDGETVEALFTVSLTEPAARTVTATFATVAETAVAGEDFEAVSGTLTFDIGESAQTVAVPILGDLVLEPEQETFRVELADAINVTIEDGVARATILDDEDCPGSNLLANPSAEEWPGNGGPPDWLPVVGGAWRRGAAPPDPIDGKWFFAAGDVDSAELIQDVDVSAFAAAIDAGGQRFVFEGWARSADELPADTARVIVEYRDLANAEVLGQFDSGAVASVLDWRRIYDERSAPVGTRWIRARLIAARNSGTTNDAWFDGLDLHSLRAAVLRVEDTAEYEGDAGFGQLAFPVTLACPFHREVSLDFSTVDGTALAGQDYLAASGSLSLAPGQAAATVPVSLVGDEIDEGHESFSLEVSLRGPAGVVAPNTVAVAEITNDDFCPQDARYWDDEGWQWHVDYLVIGGIEYDHAGIGDLLTYQGGDRASRLAGEQAVTKINLARGSAPTILSVVEEVDAFLEQFPPGSDPVGPDKRRADDLRNLLRGYNLEPC